MMRTHILMNSTLPIKKWNHSSIKISSLKHFILQTLLSWRYIKVYFVIEVTNIEHIHWKSVKKCDSLRSNQNICFLLVLTSLGVWTFFQMVCKHLTELSIPSKIQTSLWSLLTFFKSVSSDTLKYSCVHRS